MRLNANLGAWEDRERYVGSLVVVLAAVLLVAVGAVLHLRDPASSGGILIALLSLLILLALFEGAVWVFGLRAAQDSPTAFPQTPAPHAGPSAPPASIAAAEAGQARPPPESVVTLKCGECGSIFDVADTGERPLYHVCPGCGAQGVLRGEPAAPAPEAIPHPGGEAAPPPPSGAGRAAKRLKLRCGGCKEVFSVEDPGTRPLRHRCPHCQRLGEIK